MKIFIASIVGTMEVVAENEEEARKFATKELKDFCRDTVFDLDIADNDLVEDKPYKSKA